MVFFKFTIKRGKGKCFFLKSRKKIKLCPAIRRNFTNVQKTTGVLPNLFQDPLSLFYCKDAKFCVSTRQSGKTQNIKPLSEFIITNKAQTPTPLINHSLQKKVRKINKKYKFLTQKICFPIFYVIFAPINIP